MNKAAFFCRFEEELLPVFFSEWKVVAERCSVVYYVSEFECETSRSPYV